MPINTDTTLATVVMDPTNYLEMTGPGTLKEELKIWSDGVVHFDNEDYEQSINAFRELGINASAKFHFNIGIAYLSLFAIDRTSYDQTGTQEHIESALFQLSEAVKSFDQAIQADEYFAVARFQRGVCHYLAQKILQNLRELLQQGCGEKCERRGAPPDLDPESYLCEKCDAWKVWSYLGWSYDIAQRDFEFARDAMRGNKTIDYTQLGLDYKLYDCEVLYNLSLCKVRKGELQEAAADLAQAANDMDLDEHKMIQNTLEMVEHLMQSGQNVPEEQELLPFQVPPTCIYRPAKSKLENSKKKNYLGSSRVVAAVHEGDSYTGFSGARFRRGSEPEEESTAPRQYGAATMPRSAMGSPAFSTVGRSLSRPRFQTAPRAGMTPAQLPSAGPGTPMRRPSAPQQFSTMGRGIMNSPMFQSSPQIGAYDSGFGGPHQLNPGMNEQSVMTIGRGGNGITVKCHHGSDIRKISVAPDAAFETLLHQLQDKFHISDDKPLKVEYKDDEGDLITMNDDEDLEIALNAPKVEIWVGTKEE